jgi:hypothetical protein
VVKYEQGRIARLTFGGSRVLELGVLYIRKPALASLVSVFFLPLAYMSKLLTPEQLLVVDYANELSNLDLARDLADAVEYLKSLEFY